MTRIWEYLRHCWLEADWELAAHAISMDGADGYQAMKGNDDG